MERGLRVIEQDKTFFKKITNTIGKLFIPTKVGFNSMIISLKRNNVVRAYINYEECEKDDESRKKYEETYSLYLESIDKYYKINSNKSAILFKNGVMMEFNISYGSLSNQILRATRLKYVLEERTEKKSNF